MPEIVFANGSRENHRRIEIDFTGNSVVAMDDYQESKRVPFFHVGRVIYDNRIVFIEDRREDEQ